MWLNLILERVRNNYYRSQAQLWSDIELIHQCSLTYNGADEELTCKAETLVQKLKKDLKGVINQN